MSSLNITRTFQVLMFGTGGLNNPVDSTSYYATNFGLTTSATLAQYTFGGAGVLTRVDGITLTAGTLASAENATLNVLHNSTTQTAITSTLKFNAITTTFSNTGLAVAIAAGDTIAIELITPIWATNPTSVGIFGTFVVRTP